jgi:hypothetical protein
MSKSFCNLYLEFAAGVTNLDIITDFYIYIYMYVCVCIYIYIYAQSLHTSQLITC